jgi:hypothetical protein
MTRLRSTFLSIVCVTLLLAGQLPGPVGAATVWRLNLFRSAGVVYQDPYYSACTAAAAMMMLNFMAVAGTGGDGFIWTLYRTRHSPDPAQNRDMASMMVFERRHDTLSTRSGGSDPHGWRNALNDYGWGPQAMTDPRRMVYDDLRFSSFDDALKTAVRAIAQFRKPVGMMGWAGHHAQVISGYVVTGEDPATSSNFTVNAVYLSDPLRSDRIVNKLVSREQLRSGSLRLRFQTYRETDSPFDDAFTPGFVRSSVRSMASEWYRRWVIVAPIRDGLAPPTPDPTPTPTPTPPPDPTPTTAPTSTPTATPTPTPDAAATAGGSPSPTPAATPG